MRSRGQPGRQQKIVAAMLSGGHTVRGSMSKAYISNYDKYPVVPVSDSRDGCDVGWPAIARRLKASVRSDRFVICVECYPGCFEKEIEQELVCALEPQMRDTGRMSVTCPKAPFNPLCAHDLGDDPVFAFMGKYELSEFLDERALAKPKSRLSQAIGPYARHRHGRDSARRKMGSAPLLRHGEVGDPAAPAGGRGCAIWVCRILQSVRSEV